MTMQRNPSPSWFTMRNTIGVVIVAIVTPFCIRAAFTAATDDQHYISYPKNDGVGGPCATIFHPTNDVKIKQYAVQDQDFLSGLQALKDIVAKASSDGMRLRPIGTRWNMNNLPYSYEYMVETRELTYVKTGIDDTTYLTPNYQSGSSLPDRLTFVQSGVTIRNLYAALFEKGLTLPTSAVTDGMTIGGGIATGTHNAGLDFGGMQDFVRGIHLVLDGRTVFVQPSTDPVVTEAYATAMGADVLTNDDALFYNALVSYGAYGIIHGFLIEPVELCK
jgi:FAD binding domain